MTVATIGLNASLWMRHKATAAARGDWSEADFTGAMAALGCSAPVISAVRAEVSAFYSAGLVPRPDDALDSLLRIDPDELEDIVGRLFVSLDLPAPDALTPEIIPALTTVSDLALYIDRRRDQRI